MMSKCNVKKEVDEAEADIDTEYIQSACCQCMYDMQNVTYIFKDTITQTQD